MAARVRLGHGRLQVEEEADPGALPEGSQADVRGALCIVPTCDLLSGSTNESFRQVKETKLALVQSNQFTQLRCLGHAKCVVA